MEDKKESRTKDSTQKVNPLHKERIRVEFVPQKTGLAPDNPRHVMYGGMAANAKTILSVPMLRSTGNYKNILTNDEKEYLENLLDVNLSVYSKENNYWDNYTIVIPKEGISLDLSDPEDYIKYKVLLANTDVIAPSKRELQDRPKATYRFVLVRDTEDISIENAKMDATMKCYKEFGKIEDDVDTMRVLVELIETRPYAQNTKADFLRSKINTLIQANPKGFLAQITDPLLRTKVLIRRATEIGKLSKRGDYYYLRSDNSPLCEPGQDPTLSVAATFLNSPAHHDVKFTLESEIGKAEKK